MATASIPSVTTDFDLSMRLSAQVVSSARLTPLDADEAREIVLAIQGYDFDFAIGQSIGVICPASASEGPGRVRLYSIADTVERGQNGLTHIKICVKRVGPTSARLCDLLPGDEIQVSGPHGTPFQVPPDHSANLILFCTGAGIAPFRALVKHLYEDVADWTGPVWLFYGAKNPLETLYMNDEYDDFTHYYDLDSFIAFKAIGSWDQALEARADDLLRHFDSPTTHVYVAGLQGIREELDRIFGERVGSIDEWLYRKAGFMAEGRWEELLY